MPDSGTTTIPGAGPADRIPDTRPPEATAADSLVLRAFQSLPTAQQDELWQRLEDTAEPSGSSSGESPAGRSLQDACLRVYTSRSPQRSCRHLAARLGDYVRQTTGGGASDLDRHLAGCESCGQLLAQLDAIRTWRRPALREALLLWTPEPSPTSTASVLEQESDDPNPGDAKTGARERSRRLPRPPRGGGRTGRRLLVSLCAAGAAVLAALAAAGVLLAAVEDAGEHPRPADAPTLPAPDRSLPATATGSTPTDISTAARSSDRPTASATTSPTQPVAVGLPLVNYGSGLCVGSTPDTEAAGLLQLQQCTGQATQRWQRIPAGHDTYQLRNTGTGACLDGTTAGGNSVPVTLQPCRSDSGRAVQLWRFIPDAQPGAFRLLFVPPVPASDCPAHLLGPQDWPRTNPPHPGSLLVHLPNYYNSGSFLFTTG